MPIEWKEDYATLNEKIDAQHKQLFRFTNELESVLQRDQIARSEVDRLLQFMRVYLETHFRYEESCMLKHRCPNTRCNHEAHSHFKSFFKNATMEYQSNGYKRELLKKLHEFTSDWLVNHICKIDISLREYSGITS